MCGPVANSVTNLYVAGLWIEIYLCASMAAELATSKGVV